jgi:hypothetical protein
VVKALASGASHASGVGSSPTLFTILFFCSPVVQGVGVGVVMFYFFLDADGKVTWELCGSTLVHARVERSLRWTDWDY